MADQTKYAAPALDKGLDILELLAEVGAGLTRHQVSERLGRSVNEIFRMLITLERRGYISVERPGEVYRLSPKMFELAHRHPPTRFLIDCAYPVLRDVAEASHQSCHLVQYHDGDMVVLAVAQSPGTSSYSLNIGARVPVFRTASGYVFLAFQTRDEERERMIKRAAEVSGMPPPSDMSKILDRIRAQGYEEADSLQISGVRNISFPLFGPMGEAIAAVTVPYLERIGPGTVPLSRVRALMKEKLALISARVAVHH